MKSVSRKMHNMRRFRCLRRKVSVSGVVRSDIDIKGWRDDIQKQMVKLRYEGNDRVEESIGEIKSTELCKHGIYTELLHRGEGPLGDNDG